MLMADAEEQRNLADKALPRTSPKNHLVYQAVVFAVIGRTSEGPLVSLGK